MKQHIKIGMPHLIYNGLDPVWLLKHIGNNHWALLNDSTSFYKDNQRLYASFFAIELDFNKGQQHFAENDQLTIQSEIFKFNSMIHRSMHTISVDNNSATATLDSIFVKKNLSTGELVREEPISLKGMDSIDQTFLYEHKKLKKSLSLNKQDSFNLLQFNPESYFNGVKILYCANYLNLVFLSEYAVFKKIQDPIKKIKLYFFKNISENDQVYGLTNCVDRVFETTLIADNRPLGFCRVER